MRWLYPYLFLLSGLAGCLHPRPAPVTVPPWELAAADPSAPIPVARTRLCPDRPLPPRLLSELTPELSLITITRPADWAEVRRCLDLPASRVPIDFSRGILIGMQAKVGERAESGWPIHLQSIRKRTGVGRLDATFAPGLYYPLETAPYVELAYAPGLRQISMVCVDHRTFLIQPASSPDP